MKKLLLLSLCIMQYALCLSQSATTVLDRAADAIRQSGTIYAQFRVTQFDALTPAASTDGELWMQAEKFKMVTPELTTWCNGTTMWSQLKGAGEVNMIIPDEGELLTTSPYNFLGIYKKGFKASVAKGTLYQQPVYTVTLKAKDKKQSLQTVLIDVAQDDYRLMCIRAKMDGEWTRIQLPTLKTHVKVSQDIFAFDPKQHPELQVIDLR